MTGTRSRASLSIFLPLIAVVAVLYVAKDFFIPLALAILISFLLAPLIRRFERWHFHRILAVITATLLAFSVVAGIGYIVGGQLIDLANELPKYKTNLMEKAAALKTSQNGALNRATETLREVATKVTSDEPTSTAPAVPHAVPVQVVYGAGNAWDMLKSFAGPLIAPLGTAAMVIVFVVFILLELEDLRDRVIHLIGRGHLQVTTQALDEAGRKVSRYLLAQLTVNVSYGIPVGLGLYFIGVPNAVLWGLLATTLRFVPYIGPWIAAAFPIALSLAVAPGWRMPLLVLGMFIIIELISNNVVEPWLYGASTGLSPMAVIVAAAFWTWLWGAMGLLLATPLTVCIAVLGKYIPSLQFLDVLLGDRPPIATEDRFYQRLLALDGEEICELAEAYVKDHTLAEMFEEVVIPALRMGEADYRSGILQEETRAEMHHLVRDLITDFGESEAPEAKEKAIEAAAVASTRESSEIGVMCLPACNHADELVALMLARVLAQSGVTVQVCAAKLLTNEMVDQVVNADTRLLCVSVLPPSSVMPATLVCKRLRARLPEVRINVGLWCTASDERRRQRFERAGADHIFHTLTQATRELIAQVHSANPQPAAPTDIAA